MSSPGQEERSGVSQKVRYIAHVGCAEANLMIVFLMPIEESLCLSNSK